MARPLRIEFPGAIYHLTARGNARQDIYLADSDRAAFLELLGQVCERHNWRCYAYCLMPNHYHLVIETLEGRLSSGMQRLNGVFTQKFNRAHGRTGHLFQGRYHAVLVDRDSYFLALIRYVALNPVRAGLVKSVGDWRWSSYRATIGKSSAPKWLEVNGLLNQFARSRPQARRKYKDFVHAGRSAENPWHKLKNQVYLGSEDFVGRMQALIDDSGDLSEIPLSQRQRPVKPLSWFAGKYADRHQAMARAYASNAYSLAEIARHFGVHYSTVSRVVRHHP